MTKYMCVKEVFQLPGVEAAVKYLEASPYYGEMQEKLSRIGGIFLNRNQRRIPVINNRNDVIEEQQILYDDIMRHGPLGCVMTSNYGYSVDSSKKSLHERFLFAWNINLPVFLVYHDKTDTVIRVGETVAVSDPNNNDGDIMFAKVEKFMRFKVCLSESRMDGMDDLPSNTISWVLLGSISSKETICSWNKRQTNGRSTRSDAFCP